MNKVLIKIYLYITFFLFLSQKSELIAFSLTDIKKVSSKALDIKIGYSKNLKPYKQSIKGLLIGTTIGTCIKFFILVKNEKPKTIADFLCDRIIGLSALSIFYSTI